MGLQKVSFQLGSDTIELETGVMAKQADGAVLVRTGNNVVLCTVVSAKSDSDKDFFPLMVEYSEKFYAAGKFPGGFFKREGRPTANATLTARLIDRPLRPCFPEGYLRDTQIVCTVLSCDGQFPVEILASIGASSALHISDIPFNGPTATLQIGQVNGDFVVNPSYQTRSESKIDMMIAGTRNGLLMVEGEADLVPESTVLGALKFAHEQMKVVFDAQDELREKTGNKASREFTVFKVDEDFRKTVDAFAREKIVAALGIHDKMDRYKEYSSIKKEAVNELVKDKFTDASEADLRKKEVGIVIEDLKYEISRSNILDKSHRIGDRDLTTVRHIENQVSLLPRAHGSALFTRGETQVLSTVTLGTGDDEQTIDGLGETYKKQFLLHYNFPPYCVGETGRMGGQSRREIGHGTLAERAIKAVIPDHKDFPYTIRVVGEVMESNGSSSMGTVCGGIMALLDAGVPLKGNVAGIAMGLISDGTRTAVLSDILGDEDHLGDMDFKVAGTREGISAVQMDIKIDSITFEVMEKALQQAKEGRLHILGKMEETINSHRGEISQFAPRIETIKIKPEKVREVIGAGGKVIKGLIEETGVKIDIEDDGKINIASTNPEMTKKAIAMIEAICAEAELDKEYTGKVVKIVEFGAFVEVLPNTQGLLHISEIANERVRNVKDFLNEGDEVQVKVIDIDRAGRVKLSRKALLDA